MRKVVKMESLEQRVADLDAEKCGLTVKVAVLEAEKAGWEAREVELVERLRKMETQLAEAHQALLR